MPDPTPPAPSPSSSTLDVGLIQEPTVPPKDEPQAQAELEDLEHARRKLELEDFQNEVKARRRFANQIFIFMIVWMAIMALLVVADAVTIPYLQHWVGFHLSDSVLITLVTTTTGTVVGVFLIVAKYLYRVRDISA